MMATSALGQALPSIDVEQVWLDPAGRGSTFVGTGQTLGALDFRLGVAAFYTHQNLTSSSGRILTDRLGFQLFGALGVTRWLELGANVPVLALQDGPAKYGVASAGLGNPFLHAKVAVLDDTHVVMLGVALAVGVPIGSGPALGNGGLEVAPKLQLGKIYDDWQWGSELGLLYRPRVSLESVTGADADVVGSQVWLAGTVTTVNAGGPRGEASVRVHASLQGGSPGVEAQLGVRVPTGNVEFFASAGPGLFGAPTTPTLRVYLGFALANSPLTQPPCAEGRAYALASCPELDRDGDGVKNGVDGAPLDAEDRDGFRDDDGVPELDNDADGVPDPDDRCPDQPGAQANHGCADVDTDGDGVVDRLDACPAAAEDLDGFEDGDGCAELDDDGDGVPQGQDKCPRQAGVVEEGGCPAKDSDGDTVADHLDNCPQQKGLVDNAGCPAAQKQLVVLTQDKLKILDKVFFDRDRATIQRRSFRLLDSVAGVLASHAELKRIRIEGHTDDQGPDEANQKLSLSRAQAVTAYLVKKGVARSRLEPVGYGEAKPTESNATAAGREANRRVEFIIVDR
jgi:outer membrane protein OmpA-like peptidoglycan-associated protein